MIRKVISWAESYFNENQSFNEIDFDRTLGRFQKCRHPNVQMVRFDLISLRSEVVID